MKESELGKVYHDGEIIFREGDDGDRMYVIQTGKVRITKKAKAGNMLISVLESGDVFGEMALVDRLPRSATATAEGESCILGIDRTKFIQIISRDATLAFRLLESMSKRIRSVNEKLMKMKRETLDTLYILGDVSETCNLILKRSKNLIAADNGSIMLLEGEQRTLSIAAAFGTEWNPKVHFSIGEGIAGNVLETGRAEMINNVSMDPRFKPGAAAVTSVICFPLKRGDSTFGVINLSRGTEKLFTLDDMKLIHSLSLYASLAIENAIKFTQLQYAADQMIKHATLLDI